MKQKNNPFYLFFHWIFILTIEGKNKNDFIVFKVTFYSYWKEVDEHNFFFTIVYQNMGIPFWHSSAASSFGGCPICGGGCGVRRVGEREKKETRVWTKEGGEKNFWNEMSKFD